MAYASKGYKKRSHRYTSARRQKFRKYHGPTATQAALAVIARAVRSMKTRVKTMRRVKVFARQSRFGYR